MLGGKRVVRVSKGKILELVGEKGNFYNVKSGKREGRIKKGDAEVREGSIWSLPAFLVESSAARAEVLIDRLSREIKREVGESL